MHHTAPTTSYPGKLRARALGVICAVVVLSAVAAAPATAAPHVDGKFAVSGVGANNEITRDRDGNVWVTLDQGNDIARINRKGKVKEFDPVNVTGPVGITIGPDDNLWVTQSGGVAVFSPDDPDAAVKYPVGDIADARPIVTGPDGALWTVSGENVIRIDPADPSDATSFPELVAGRDIDAGKDGRLWAADFDGQVVRLTTAGTARAFPTGNGSGLQALAAGPRGQIAYADPTSNPQKVGRVTNGRVSRTTAPGDPFGVAFGTDRAYWIPRFASGDLLRMTIGGETSVLRGLGEGSGPRRIAAGPGRTLWVTLDNAEKVARVSGVRR